MWLFIFNSGGYILLKKKINRSKVEKKYICILHRKHKK